MIAIAIGSVFDFLSLLAILILLGSSTTVAAAPTSAPPVGSSATRGNANSPFPPHDATGHPGPRAPAKTP
jgi:hypothetical protein